MLTLRFIPYHEIENLNSQQRIDKLIKIAKQESIILMQGRLTPAEEANLIQETMLQISSKFKGVEICTIYPESKNLQIFKKLKHDMINFLLGHREGITIIGPASVIKDIKRDPNKIQLLVLGNTTKRKKPKR